MNSQNEYGPVPVAYELYPDGEAYNVHFFCSVECRSHFIGVGLRRMPPEIYAEGMNHEVDVPSQTVCEWCEKLLDGAA